MRVRALVVTAAVGGLALLATACEPGPTTTRVSLSKGGGELRSTTFHPSISDDGTRVVFATYGAVFVRDRSAGTTTRVDVPASSGPTARTSTNASNPVISGNGRYVAFTSTENVGDCPDVRRNVYVRDLQTATTTCVSVSTGGDFGDGDSIQAAISTTGRYVTFVSRADNLVAHDDNGKPDVFLRDTILDTTGLVSVHADGSQFNGVANRVSPVSADGDAVAFWSTDHQDENTTASVFVRVLTGSPTTELASDGDRSILNFAMSDHGRFVAFVSADEHGVNQVYVRDRDDNSL